MPRSSTHKIADMVIEALHDNFAGFRLKLGFAAEVLLEGMQLAYVHMPARHQRLRHLLKDRIQLLDMLQHQAETHQVVTIMAEGPWLRDVGLDEFGDALRIADGFDFLLGLGKHFRAEVHSYDAICKSSVPDGVFACTGTDFED